MVSKLGFALMPASSRHIQRKNIQTPQRVYFLRNESRCFDYQAIRGFEKTV